MPKGIPVSKNNFRYRLFLIFFIPCNTIIIESTDLFFSKQLTIHLLFGKKTYKLVFILASGGPFTPSRGAYGYLRYLLPANGSSSRIFILLRTTYTKSISNGWKNCSHPEASGRRRGRCGPCFARSVYGGVPPACRREDLKLFRRAHPEEALRLNR